MADSIQVSSKLPRWLRWMAPSTWWVIFLVTTVPVIVVAAVAIAILLSTIDVTNNAVARVELVKTGLAVGAGAAGLAALALASRRQWSNERTARSTEHDATERRITELYTKAVEQLGHIDAAVRLGGLYALERLGQNTPSQRETILNVICAYLRMPYIDPGEHPGHDATQEDHDRYHLRMQQRQVRLTAQRILHRHLSIPITADKWAVPPPDLGEACLANADLHHADLALANLGLADLTGANLAVADLSGANLTAANLSHADLTRTQLINADLVNADLSGAAMAGADLTRACLINASLTGTNLAGANLMGANLSAAQLRGANLTDADLNETNLHGADLTNALGVTHLHDQ